MTKQDFIRRNSTIDSQGCWIWQRAKTSRGYGCLVVQNEAWLAHRYAYRVFVGPIPKGMQICHRCDTPLCVNPKHLFVGTQLDNVNDMYAKGRGVGRPKELVMKMIEAAATSESGVSIARRLGVTTSSISRIRTGQTWMTR